MARWIMVRASLTIIALLLPVATGCQSIPWMPGASTAVADKSPADGQIAKSRAGSTSQVAPVNQAASFAAARTVDDTASTGILPLSDRQLQQDDAVLRELQAISSSDPVAAQQLIARLQETQPSLRPLVARQFRTSWEYHQQLAGATGSTQLADHTQAEPAHRVASLPAEYHAPQTTPATATLSTTGSAAAPPTPVVPVPPSAPTTPPAAEPVVEEPPQASTTPADQPTVIPASYESGPKLMPTPVGVSEAPREEVERSSDWQTALDELIDRLADQSSADPRSTVEAYQHVRLRLLQLVAGQTDKAFEPIPGLTPTEQAYWSNQLFAISTLLQFEEQSDDQRRASLAASQLAEAAAKLGELSSLAIRSTTFCDKVYGFGDYDKLDEGAFKPGQTVTLYAEIDNFRSESTEKGYHTSLATSYEVLDQAGNRVDGGEFGNVDDYCLNKRQDFYIEYTFQLPDRIYASKYQLRLLIRDRLSGKISKSTIDFEIEE